VNSTCVEENDRYLGMKVLLRYSNFIKGVIRVSQIATEEDLHDGITFERFLEATENHKRVNILFDPSQFILQQLDYL